jgi:hypothetical protein
MRVSRALQIGLQDAVINGDADLDLAALDKNAARRGGPS